MTILRLLTAFAATFTLLAIGPAQAAPKLETAWFAGGWPASIAEPATFGNKDQPWLRATIAGEVRRDTIEFVKTYDGTGGVNHSVSYRGELDRDNGLILGRYTISSGESEGFVIWLAH